MVSGQPFRDWRGDHGVQREIAEAALGHVVPGVEGAYRRRDALALRRHLIQQWAKFIEPPWGEHSHKCRQFPRGRGATFPRTEAEIFAAKERAAQPVGQSRIARVRVSRVSRLSGRATTDEAREACNSCHVVEMIGSALQDIKNAPGMPDGASIASRTR
jgi:hypothetical protein